MQPCRGTIFFDFDGTVYDSMSTYAPALREACAWLKDQGFETPDISNDAAISCWLGWSVEEMWANFAPRIPKEIAMQASKIVGRVMREMTEQGKGRLFEGAQETLGELKRMGYRLVVLSNCAESYMTQNRKAFGLDAWFEAYYCAGAYNFAPKHYIYMLVQDESPKPHCIVGDRFHDMEVGKKNEIPFIAAEYGFCLPGELDEASFRAGSIAELPDLVAKVLSEK